MSSDSCTYSVECLEFKKIKDSLVFARLPFVRYALLYCAVIFRRRKYEQIFPHLDFIASTKFYFSVSLTFAGSLSVMTSNKNQSQGRENLDLNTCCLLSADSRGTKREWMD